MIHKIKTNKEIVIEYVISLILVIAYWGGMLAKSFSGDTLSHMYSTDGDVYTRLSGGRYVLALLDFLLYKVGLSTTTNITATEGVAFALLAASMVLLHRAFAKWLPTRLLWRIASCLAIDFWVLTVFMAEMLMFSEFSAYFALSYLLSAISILLYTKENRKGALAFAILAIYSYQYAAIFEAVVLVFYVGLKHDLKFGIKSIVEEFRNIIICLLIGLSNMLSCKILEKVGILAEAQKTVELGDLSDKFEHMFESFIEINSNGNSLLTDYWIAGIYSLLILILLLFTFAKLGCMGKWFYSLTMFLGSIILMYGLTFLEDDAFFPPRMSFIYFLIQGLMTLLVITYGADLIRNIASVLCCGYLVIHLIFAHFIVADRFTSNKLDIIYANMINERIFAYEGEKGITVNKLAVTHDIDASSHYNEIRYSYEQINERCLTVAPYSLLRYVTGRDYERVPVDEKIYSEYFESRDWDYINLDEQLVIVDDTAYWCVF